MTFKILATLSNIFIALSSVSRSVNAQCYNNGYGYGCGTHGLYGGGIAGIVVGIIALVLFCLLLCLFMRRRRRFANAAYSPPTVPAMTSYASGPGASYQPHYGPTSPPNGNDDTAEQIPPPPQYTKYEPQPVGSVPQTPGTGEQPRYQPSLGPPPTAPPPTYNPNTRPNDHFVGGFRTNGAENV
ncbi:hypothetical protein NEOLEDRAFT_814302 [Neolentinus lepideus HHB14362 ss-1]|uniref:Uncharacterized protein n=1 Tax=Neolentinus lepideus HHB14362 ss-1 TaxID=1314782 RepID=A0A165PCD0_9AGAM|nr:hypothetical protein NEOLEDRAFT_814302 [Neolentinus lepideus HHB14362 ss-1]